MADDVCLAGNPAKNGRCGEPGCVCEPKLDRWQVGPAGRRKQTILLPKPGGAVRGVYMGVPFVGTLVSARFHSYCGDLLCHVSFAPEQRITVFGLVRDGVSLSISEDGTDRHMAFCEAVSHA